MRTLLTSFALVYLGLPARADEAAAEEHARVVAPYVNDQTFLVAHIDVGKIDLDVAAKLTGEDVEKAKALAALAKRTFLRAGGKDLYVVLNWGTGPDEALVVVPLSGEAAVTELTGLVRQVPGFQPVVKNNVLLAGTPKALNMLKNFKAQPLPNLAKAFAGVGEGGAQIVFLPPFALKRAFLEMYPRLPKELGGGDSAALDFDWAAARVDLGQTLSLKAVAQAPDAKSAAEIRKIFGQAVEFASAQEDIKRGLPNFAQMATLLAPKVQGERLTVELNNDDLGKVLLPLIARQRQAAGNMVSVNNLRQIALGMHNYLETYRTFPPAASHDAQGKPLLSWRVYLLPYLEQDALFRAFHLDEPWDSEHNKKLIAQMPAVYRSPAQKNAGEGKTTYLVPVGPKTIFEPGAKRGTPIGKITDGTSNTIMLLEVDDAKAVYWTQPEDYKIDPKNPKTGLVRPGTRTFNAGFADGSVRALPETIDAATLRALYTANGGEAVNLP
jgi:hypothetical protein